MLPSVPKRNKNSIMELCENSEIISEPIVLFDSWLCLSIYI